MTAVTQWVLDTRPLWPEAHKTQDLATAASRALALVSVQEREQVLRFYFVRDAKLALGSALLKRLAISRLANVSWEAARWTRDSRTGKPVFLMDQDDGVGQVRFNVSHQAGLVVLVASLCDADVDVGIDVVCPSERRDRDRNSIAAEGWSRYVAVHEDVFGPAEAASLRARNDDVDRRLEYFYALWCLREAYIKMTGDALLAPWLRQLEMRHFAPPDVEATSALEIWFHGRRVQDVCMRLRPLLDDYMVCTAVRCPPQLRARIEEQVAKPFTHLVLDHILSEAETGKALSEDGQ